MKNTTIEIDKRRLLDSMMDNLEKDENKKDRETTFYYKTSKAFSFSGFEDSEVENLIKSAENELQSATYAIARASIMIGYLRTKEEIFEEADDLQDTIHELIESYHMMSQSLIDSYNIKVKMSFETSKNFGGYNPLEDPHGGK